jgi:L-malate glycosyltransferase
LDKVRILYVQETIGSGGVERRRFNLVKLLDKSKYEFKIVCTKIVGPLADEIRAENVEVIEIGLLSKVWDIRRYKAVLDIIKRYKPHIIHGAVFEGVLLATIAGALGRVPIIIAEETSVPIDRTRKATLLLKGLSFLADKFVGVSQAAYNYLLTEARIIPNKLKLIVNGVSAPPEVGIDEVTQLSQKYGISESDFIVGSVGRLFNNVKLFTDLIDALSILKGSHPNLKLLIVGEGPDKEYITNYAVSKQVSNRVIMAGYQFNPHPFFKLMDIFALVSSTESFGLAAVEAMYHKLPVIASKVGGLKHIVIQGETGLLVDAHHPGQIADAIKKICSTKFLAEEMGGRGYTRAVIKYSATRYVNEVEMLYKELLIEKRIVGKRVLQ